MPKLDHAIETLISCRTGRELSRDSNPESRKEIQAQIDSLNYAIGLLTLQKANDKAKEERRKRHDLPPTSDELDQLEPMD